MSTTYGFTNKYLTKDEKPWFPVMGEIHFSRYRADLWEESLRESRRFVDCIRLCHLDSS